MFKVKVVEKNKTFLCSITFFKYSCRLWDNLEKHGGVKQSTDGSILRRMYKVVQIRSGQTVTCLHTNRPGHI
jgi:hypothetical protein